MLLEDARKQIIDICRKLVKYDLVNMTAGNVSYKDNKSNLVAVTPSGMDYMTLEPVDIVVVDMSGKVVEGNRKPSIETPMHLAIYKVRPDIAAVVHTHSLYATAIGCLGIDLPVVTLEIAMHIGSKVPVSCYAMPSTKELAQNVAEMLRDHNATLMPNHGVCAVGRDLNEALSNAYAVELSAKIYHIAKTLGEPKTISQDEVRKIREFAETKYGQR